MSVWGFLEKHVRENRLKNDTKKPNRNVKKYKHFVFRWDLEKQTDLSVNMFHFSTGSFIVTCHYMKKKISCLSSY